MPSVFLFDAVFTKAIVGFKTKGVLNLIPNAVHSNTNYQLSFL